MPTDLTHVIVRTSDGAFDPDATWFAAVTAAASGHEKDVADFLVAALESDDDAWLALRDAAVPSLNDMGQLGYVRCTAPATMLRAYLSILDNEAWWPADAAPIGYTTLVELIESHRKLLALANDLALSSNDHPLHAQAVEALTAGMKIV